MKLPAMATLALLSAGACSKGPAAYLLECTGTQRYEWARSQASSLTTLYYRIDEQRRTVFGRTSAGQFNTVCRTSCAAISFGKDAIRWTDSSADGEGRSTTISSQLSRSSGELRIRTESREEGRFGSEETLHGEGIFQCHQIDHIPSVARAAL